MLAITLFLMVLPAIVAVATPLVLGWLVWSGLKTLGLR